MKFRLLVVDDELGEAISIQDQARTRYYDLLSKKFHLTYVNKKDELTALVAQKSYDAVLLDFVLDAWNMDVAMVLKMVDPDVPVALISKHWGPHFDKLRHVLEDYRAQIAQLFTWDDLVDEKRRDVMEMWLDTLIRRARGLASRAIEPDDTIRILQLSDLQFGSKLPDTFEVETDLLAQEIRSQFGKPPDFIALTGDLAERGLPSEFDLAREWILGLALRLDPAGYDGRFLVVPGNHDLCWPLGWSSHIDLSKPAISSSVNSELRRFVYAPYFEFVTHLDSGTTVKRNKHFWTNGRYRHLGVIFFGYDSTESLDEWFVPTKAVVDKTVAEMNAELREFEIAEPTALTVGLIHYPLVCDLPKEQISNMQVLLRGRPPGRSVVFLTGHAHAEGYAQAQRNDVHFLQIEASSATKLEADRPPDTLRGFNLIELVRHNGYVGEIRLHSCSFGRWGIKTETRVCSRNGDGLLSPMRQA